MIWNILTDVLRDSILITGLVIVMMMLIESFNIESRGQLFTRLQKSNFGQITVSALLGAIPGCMGGFASVSLYTHRMLSFGALVAMMVATAGDESFLMLALFPGKSALLFAILFVLAIITGAFVDYVLYRRHPAVERFDHQQESFCHEMCEEKGPEGPTGRHFSWERVIMFVGVALFITALVGGTLKDHSGGLNLLDEGWLNILFAAISVTVLIVLIFGSDNFVEEHLWHHIIRKHLPGIFAWTFGVMLVIGIALHFVDIRAWVSDNTSLTILLAIAIGLIPESGPHMVFVTLFASGIIPFPVLLANSITQEGHAGLPLLAESKLSFIKAKTIKVVLALIVSFAFQAAM